VFAAGGFALLAGAAFVVVAAALALSRAWLVSPNH
jgi:hypothetical protein